MAFTRLTVFPILTKLEQSRKNHIKKLSIRTRLTEVVVLRSPILLQILEVLGSNLDAQTGYLLVKKVKYTYNLP